MSTKEKNAFPVKEKKSHSDRCTGITKPRITLEDFVTYTLQHIMNSRKENLLFISI